MKSQFWLHHSGNFKNDVEISLPLSKSISNRVLILEAISSGSIYSKKYSDSSDTNTLISCIKNINSTFLDAKDAGTTFRFLVALASLSDHEITISGTTRMKKRPVKGLVEVLQNMGAEILYLEKKGFPPLKIKPPKNRLRTYSELKIHDTSSSQFISALMLIAPVVKNGIHLTFPPFMPSYSYIEMTAEILRQAEIDFELGDDFVKIPEQNLSEKKKCIEIEKDWSSASYFFSMMACGSWENIFLKGLSIKSIQRDTKIIEYFKPLGIAVEENKEGIMLRKVKPKTNAKLIFDFKDNPDLSLTVIVAYALNKIDIKVKGIENLVIKESDRIESLKLELRKINVDFYKVGNFWQLQTAGLNIPKSIYLNTYNDHRIAMAFSVLAIHSRLEIDNPAVVNKSFLGFWDQLTFLGLELNY